MATRNLVREWTTLDSPTVPIDAGGGGYKASSPKAFSNNSSRELFGEFPSPVASGGEIVFGLRAWDLSFDMLNDGFSGTQQQSYEFSFGLITDPGINYEYLTWGTKPTSYANIKYIELSYNFNGTNDDGYWSSDNGNRFDSETSVAYINTTEDTAYGFRVFCSDRTVLAGSATEAGWTASTAMRPYQYVC